MRDWRDVQPFHLHARRRARERRHPGAAWHAGAAFFETQVLKSDTYVLQSDANRLRPLPLPPPRGTIFDRNGEIIADNVPGYALSVLPGPEDSVRATLERLAPLLDLTPSRIDALMARRRRAPGQPLLVSSDLTFDQVSAIQERRLFLPGVYVDERPKRRYPDGPAVAHLVGYIGEISEEELARPEYEGYSAGQLIGKPGSSGGTSISWPGRPACGTWRWMPMAASSASTPRGEWCSRSRRGPPSHIDLDLQRWVARIFPTRCAGRSSQWSRERGTCWPCTPIPASTPTSSSADRPGGLAALTQDPAAFVAQSRHRRHVSAGVGVQAGHGGDRDGTGRLDPDQPLPIPCRGGMQYGNRYFRCWERAGHGYVTLPDAIRSRATSTSTRWA